MKVITPATILIAWIVLTSSMVLKGQSCTSPLNLALGQNTEQSSTYGFGASSLAVDGDTDGTRGPWGNTPSIIHTQNEFQPWWQVELAEAQLLDSLVIYNRTDCCSERLANFYVLLSDSPFPAFTLLDTLLANPGIQSFYFEGIAGAKLRLDPNFQGKYLRIQLSGQGILNIAELQAWGCMPTSSCPPPTRLTADVSFPDRVRLLWEETGNVSTYEVRYRELGSNDWQSSGGDPIPEAVALVEREREYEWEVRSLCATENSEWVKGPVFTTQCMNAETVSSLMKVEQLTASSAVLDWEDAHSSVALTENYRYRKQGEERWIEGTVEDPVDAESRVELMDLESNTSYEWEGLISCGATGLRVYTPGPDFTTLAVSATADLRWVPTLECPEGVFKARLQIRGASEDTFRIGTASILARFNEAALQFQGYESLNFDRSSTCTPGTSSGWDTHAFDGVSTLGTFNLTLVLNVEARGCPTITPEQWIDMGEISFLILDENQSPELVFDSPNTNFNVDNPNDGSITVAKRNLQALSGNILTCQGNLAPIASFTATPRSGQAPLEVNFDASASSDPDGQILSYLWEFGDGFTGTGISINHTYSGEGSYSPQLIVTDELGASDTLSSVVMVSAPSDTTPTANLRLVDSLDCDNNRFYTTLQVQAANSQSFQIGTSSILFTFNNAALEFLNYQSESFDEDDLCIAGIVSPWDRHSFDGTSFQGTFNLTLVLNNEGFGCPEVSENGWINIGVLEFSILNQSLDPAMVFDRVNTNLNVDQPNDGTVQVAKGNFESLTGDILACSVNQDPVGSFAINPNPSTVGIETTFDASAYTDPEGGELLYTWDFGDGTIGDLALTTHTYDSAGTYLINLTVYDPDGGFAEDSQELLVEIEDSISGPCATSTNLALGKLASQSTTYGNGEAGLAVDGNTDGQGSPWGANASLQHTQNEASPWWEVDLEEGSRIDSILVYNRTGCCQERLRNLYVLVSSLPFNLLRV